MLAWSSVAAMGTILIGVAIGSELAVSGALFHMVAHALATGALFLRRRNAALGLGRLRHSGAGPGSAPALPGSSSA